MSDVPPPVNPHEVTHLLAALREGDSQAMERLAPLVYAELRRLAGVAMRRERAEHTWQPTELVHEAFMRLVKATSSSFVDRRHFYAIAARIMRQVLVDHARARRRSKRDGNALLPLHDTIVAANVPAIDVMALDDALARLAATDARAARIVELRYFAGLTLDEAAATEQISVATAKRDWSFARAWLRLALQDHALVS